MKMEMIDAAALEMIEAAQDSTSSRGAPDAVKEVQIRRHLIRSSSLELESSSSHELEKALANINSSKSEAWSRIDLSKDI